MILSRITLPSDHGETISCLTLVQSLHGDADLGEADDVLVAVDRDIVTMPIGERGTVLRDLEVAHPADHDAVGMALDDILDLAVDRGEALWSEARGTKNVSLEGCDLGEGAGKLEVAYAKLPRYFAYLDKEIGTKDFLVGGKFSIADISVATQFANLAHTGYSVDAAKYPNIVRYVKAIHARPSFAACIAEESGFVSKLGL